MLQLFFENYILYTLSKRDGKNEVYNCKKIKFKTYQQNKKNKNKC